MLNLRLRVLCALALVVYLGCAPADDTDIYLNPSVPSGGEPLVMFVLDWRPNLGSTVSCAVGSYCAALRADGYLSDGKTAASGLSTTFFDVLRAVFKKVLDPLDGVRIGLMINHAHKNGCSGFPPANKCSNGAYVMLGFRAMSAGTDDPDTWQTTGEDADKVELAALLNAIPMPGGNQSHPFQGKELYFELFRYLTGQGVYNGHTGYVDYGDGPNDTRNLDNDRPAIDWDATIETGGGANVKYVSPISPTSECAKIYVINLMFQVSQQEDDSDTAIKATKVNGGMEGINLSGPNNNFATVVQYLNHADLANGTFGTAPNLDGVQNVISYFVVDPTKINVTTTSYATAGGTGVPLALSDDPEVLIETLDNIFTSILSVSTTFVAPSVPVNVFNRSEIINEVFLALFEADENALPFWPGNLKKVKIGDNESTGVPELQDANGNNAIDIDGRLRNDALTFWTDGASLPAPTGAEVAGADGRTIMRGGAGQNIPGFIGSNPGLSNASGLRKLFTEDPSDTTDGLRTLDGDATTATALWSYLTARYAPAAGASYTTATTANQDSAVLDLRYARGYAAQAIGDTTTMRDWFMGDPLHSRPRPINYGARTGYSTTNPDIRILMATSDGVLHMIRNTATDTSQSGAATWGFLPRAALSRLNRLRTAATGSDPVHPIGLDGSPVILQYDHDRDGTIEPGDGDKVYAFVGMRRGGKGYYAMDVSDPDTPKFLWSIDQSMTDFSELGQTWSTPTVGYVDIGSGAQPVIIFGGGYNGDDDGDNLGDLGKDAANRTNTIGSNDDEGNAIFMVNATTGALIWKAAKGATAGYVSASKKLVVPGLTDSIPSELAVADTNGDGYFDRFYVGDTGGQLWRGDIAGTDRSAWSLVRILNAGRHYASGAANDRRFFNRPDIVQTRDGNGNFDAILIGSGDREDPLDTVVLNQFYMVKDRNVVSGSPPSTTLTPASLADLTVDCVTTATCTTTTLDNLRSYGWRFDLGNAGEKNLAGAVTVGATVFFTTFMPGSSAGTCGLSEGEGFQYAVSLQDAAPVYNYDVSNDIGGETKERSDALGSGGIPVEVVPVGDEYVLVQGQEVGQNIQRVDSVTNWRTYWYELPQ